jgi:hypothetical protein
MSDDAIYELMRREADRAPIGDGDDLRRGRARLRRHRLVVGGTGFASLALAAALVGSFIAGPYGGQVASTPDRHSAVDAAKAAGDRTGRAVTKAVSEATRIEEFGQDGPRYGILGGIGTGASFRLTDVAWRQTWHEAGGVGLLQVTVARPLEEVQVPPRWFTGCAERFGGWLGGPWPDTFDDCDRRRVDGQPLFAGVERRSDRLWILVKYLREDGVVVELGFDSPYLKSDRPVVDPSLTVDQLVDVVTDPHVRMYLDEPLGSR